MLLLWDLLVIQLSFVLAFYIRFEKILFIDSEMKVYLTTFLMVIITVTLIKIIVLYLMKMYSSLWRYASVEELFQIIFASIFATSGFMGYMLIMGHAFPRSIYILTFIFDTLLFGLGRLSYRVARVYKERKRFGHSGFKKVLIVGAGQAGAVVIKELKNHSELNSRPVAVIDDDMTKIGKSINGVPIVGTRLSIRECVVKEDIDQIIIAIPSADKSTIKEIVNEASQTSCELKIVPGMFELIDGNFDISKLRNVEISDLLGRKEIVLKTEAMKSYVAGKVIMVTGGGGSIGSELCRQIAKYDPEKLIILDNYENNAFSLEHELKKKHPNLGLEVVIASVRDRDRIFSVVGNHKPYVIFHAAAHKHVPLMEANPSEAIKNNVFGSLNVIEAAKEHLVDRFVLISTDKAVNPTNVMGATKRITELLVQSQRECKTTKFVAVRFGNVLGSNGSVIPIFKKQIEEGGPITVTHPDIERYFMTIPEAARLVIQASSFGRNSEIFVLDMGEPVKITSLAENLIRLSGLRVNEDIKIEFTGLRPGEKMFEELILNEDNMNTTAFEKIFIEKSEVVTETSVKKMLTELRDASTVSDAAIRKTLKTYIPTFTYNERD
ncbi:polysaccharide biosynthesis protein [Fusibacter sp. A1]|nr:polysaccharide biosynthesis protein [Fusibacter sp. A1]RXV59237.1 polysaccharide biosynthesis protein [Fusibacter sp. A1]